MADWRSAFPELSQEWVPTNTQPQQDQQEPEVNFGSVVLSDTLQERPEIASHLSEPEPEPEPAFVPGTVVVREDQQDNNNDEQQQQLAWAAKAVAGRQDLLHGHQHSQGSQAASPVKATPRNKLQSLFEPPPESQTGPTASVSGQQQQQQQHPAATPGEVQESTPAYVKSHPNTAIRLPPPAKQTTTPSASLNSTRSAAQFTFSCPRSRSSWKSLEHFNSSQHHEQRQEEEEEDTGLLTPHLSRAGPSSRQTEQQSKARPLRLFQFNYDTYTKNHLEALVEEIDGLTLTHQQQSPAEPQWREGSPDHVYVGEQEEDEEEHARPMQQCHKRMRLSPEALTHRSSFSLSSASQGMRTPGSALRDRIRSRRATQAAHHSEYTPSQTPVAASSARQAQSLPAGFQPQQLHSAFAASRQPEEVEQTEELAGPSPTGNKMQAAEALMSRIISSHQREALGQSYISQSTESSEVSDPTPPEEEEEEEEEATPQTHEEHLEYEQDPQQGHTNTHTGNPLPPVLEVTEEEIDPTFQPEEDQEQEEEQEAEERYGLWEPPTPTASQQPMGSPALSDGTVPMPPSPSLFHVAGAASPTFPRMHHQQHQPQPQQQQQRGEGEGERMRQSSGTSSSDMSLVESQGSATARHHQERGEQTQLNHKWSSVAEASLRRSLSERPALPNTPRQQQKMRWSGGADSRYKPMSSGRTRVSSNGSQLSVQSMGGASTAQTSISQRQQPKPEPEPRQRQTSNPKHPQMTTIAPADVAADLEALTMSQHTGMVFDQERNCWFKAKGRRRASSTQQQQEVAPPPPVPEVVENPPPPPPAKPEHEQEEVREPEDSSAEDPFKDFESFADSPVMPMHDVAESEEPQDHEQDHNQGEELEEEEGEQPQVIEVVDVPQELGAPEPSPIPTTDSESERGVPLYKQREQTPFVGGAPTSSPATLEYENAAKQSIGTKKPVAGPSKHSNMLSPPEVPFSLSSSTPLGSPIEQDDSPSLRAPSANSSRHSQTPKAPLTPLAPPRSHSAPAAVPRSALKSRSSIAIDATPVPKAPSASTSVVGNQTSGSQGTAARSVSFSDGRKTGKMRDATPIVIPAFKRSGSQVPRSSGLKNEVNASSDDSTREMSHSATEEETGTLTENDSREVPLPPMDIITDSDEEPVSPPGRLNSSAAAASSRSRATRIRPRSEIDFNQDPFTSRSSIAACGSSKGGRGQATFLTECSFGISHDRLVKLITDVQPYEPSWEDTKSINLSGKQAESLVRMKEFLPNLDEADLAENNIAWLTGLPSGIRTLLLGRNRLTSVTSFGHLRNLERLDISNNQLESVSQLACLRHLRELKADNNRITDISGLSGIDGLLKLSMKGNRLRSIDFSTTSWHRLESLSLSGNALQDVHGLEHLKSCVFMSLEENRLVSVAPTQSMPALRVLRLSKNPIASFDASPFCNIRTLFIDNARLGSLHKLESLTKLENLSVREQHGPKIQLITKSLRDIRRLYMSGNSLPRSFPSYQYYDLVYLELASCQLITLPDNFSSLVPNCRFLDLSHNFLEDISPISDLKRLRQLSIVGSRLERSKMVVSSLKFMKELELLDLRLNPLTLSFYGLHAPESKSSASGSGIDDGGHEWRKADRKYVKTMPDLWYLRRMAYRGAVMQVCPSLKLLDGVKTEDQEQRNKIIDLCQQIEDRQRSIQRLPSEKHKTITS